MKYKSTKFSSEGLGGNCPRNFKLHQCTGSLRHLLSLRRGDIKEIWIFYNTFVVNGCYKVETARVCIINILWGHSCAMVMVARVAVWGGGGVGGSNTS